MDFWLASAHLRLLPFLYMGECRKMGYYRNMRFWSFSKPFLLSSVLHENYTSLFSLQTYEWTSTKAIHIGSSQYTEDLHSFDNHTLHIYLSLLQPWQLYPSESHSHLSRTVFFPSHHRSLISDTVILLTMFLWIVLSFTRTVSDTVAGATIASIRTRGKFNGLRSQRENVQKRVRHNLTLSLTQTRIHRKREESAVLV